MSRDTAGRPRVSYVTDLERTAAGGGSYVVNWHAFDQLRRRFDADYAGPLVPRVPRWNSAVSRFQRKVLHRPGDYAYFSPAALDKNATMVASRVRGDSDAIVFRSAGRWCRYVPKVPYFVYLDAVVHTFFHNTFDPGDFSAGDLSRIWAEEAAFLEGASGVFFENAWGLAAGRAAYGLRAGHYEVAGRGCGMVPPASDSWTDGSHRLITIAMNFRQKGGDVVAAAYRKLKPRFPSLEWSIVGGKPDAEALEMPGVQYEGLLSVDNPEHLRRLRHLLGSAFLCAHPTREDVSPLVVTEAAYFGCPSVSMNAFAIPELIRDGSTGLLLDPPASGDALASAIASLLVDPVRYTAMRKAARENALENFSWDRTGDTICNRIAQTLAGQ